MANFPCLICGSKEYTTNSCDDGDSDRLIISKQLNVIFILKYLLQIPSIQLGGYLEKCGNPDSWISLCAKCIQLTGEARSLHFQIIKLSSKLRALQSEIVETIKRPVNSAQLKLGSSQKVKVWREVKSFVHKHDYNSNQVTATGTSADQQQQCPNCLTQIQIHLQQICQGDDDIPTTKFHQCLYCTSEYPSITSVLKHIQAVHELKRLPCLFPNCDATLKNMKNFWEHRQRHKRKDEAAFKAKAFPKLLEPSSKDDDNERKNFDCQDELHQKDMIKVIPEDVAEAEEEPDFLEDPASSDDLQDNRNDKDDDWLANEDGQTEVDTELDVKPVISSDTTDTLEVTETEDTACFSTIIKGGTRTTQQCPRCPLKFPSISSTLRHLSSTHHLKKLPCLHPGCTSALSSIKAYFCHRKIHLYPPKKKRPRGPYKKKERIEDEGPCLCDVCGASFKKNQNLRRHKIAVHLKRWKSTQRKVTCHLCGIPFKSGYLKKHILFMHKGEEGMGALFQCNVVGCKLFFIRKEGLDKHVEKKHGNGQGAALKQFKCSFCEKEFCFKRKLEQHELSHRNQQLGIKPFVCHICGKGFGVPQNLNNHLKYTHKLAKKFQSNTCER